MLLCRRTWAFVHSVLPLISSILPDFDVDDVLLAATTEWCQKCHVVAPALSNLGCQREWDQMLIQRIFQNLLDTSTDIIDKAHLLAVSALDSGAWVNALPSPVLGNLLDDDSLRIAVALRLGSSICQPHSCHYGKLVDVLGHHRLSCKFSAGRHSRHGAINGVAL
ncbi:hypothetical protein O6H91_Y506600 [Diphasiastrum complanatum]|nr:hypothetical protein O6H91_Y506600 [Diphasiastrum complanatum]